jgi:hypothetical protein
LGGAVLKKNKTGFHVELKIAVSESQVNDNGNVLHICTLVPFFFDFPPNASPSSLSFSLSDSLAYVFSMMLRFTMGVLALIMFSIVKAYANALVRGALGLETM